MSKNDNDYRITWLCEFEDKKTEREYFTDSTAGAIKYMGPAVLLLGLLYMLFIIPDYFLVKNLFKFNLILLNRFIFLIMAFVLYRRIRTIKDYYVLPYWVSLFEVYSAVSFLLAELMYSSPDFLIQAFGVIVIVLALFSIPNRWLFSTLVSSMAGIAFFILSYICIKHIKPQHFWAGVVYILIVITLCSAISFRINLLRRLQFIDHKRLVHISSTDTLTGAFNRTKLNEETAYWMEYSERYKSPLSLIIFDYDDFKKINDTFGHIAGDSVIVESVQLLSNIVRNTDIFARWGGEEFVVLLPNTEKKQAIELAERMRKLMENSKFYKEIKITCSFGVIQLDGDRDIEAFINRADKLLYKAKNQGKNSVVSQ